MFSKKFVSIILISALIIVATVAVLYRNLKTENNQVQKQAQDLLDKNGEFEGGTNEAQVTELKQALLFLAQEVGDIKNSEGGVEGGAASSYSRVSSSSITGSINSSADMLIRI